MVAVFPPVVCSTMDFFGKPIFPAETLSPSVQPQFERQFHLTVVNVKSLREINFEAARTEAADVPFPVHQFSGHFEGLRVTQGAQNSPSEFKTCSGCGI